MWWVLACTARVSAPEKPVIDPLPQWQGVLRRATSGGTTDWVMLEEHRSLVQQTLGWIAHTGPETELWKESHEHKRVSYMLNAYQIGVIAALLERPELRSLADVDVGLIRGEARGFLHGVRVHVDGEWQSFDRLGRTLILHRYQTPEIMAGLSCGSVDCPPFRWWAAGPLDGDLEQHLGEWLAGGALRRTEAGWGLVDWAWRDAAAILYWTGNDDLCQWLAPLVEGDARVWLESTPGCPLERLEMDWSIRGR